MEEVGSFLAYVCHHFTLLVEFVIAISVIVFVVVIITHFVDKVIPTERFITCLFKDLLCNRIELLFLFKIYC